MQPLLLPSELNCGYFDCSEFGNLCRSTERCVRQYEIELYLENGRETFINGQSIPIRQNHIIISRPGDRRYSLLPFKTLFLKFSAADGLSALLDELPSHFVAVHARRIRELLHEIIVLNESKEPDACFLFGRMLLLLGLLRQDAAQNRRGIHGQLSAMHDAKAYIEAHYGEKITSADVAGAVHLSDSRLRCLFRATYGISPHQYLVDVRISAAKQMLWDTDIPISAIAERCGFGCQQYFNDIFKRETNSSPGRYRRAFSRKYSL